MDNKYLLESFFKTFHTQATDVAECGGRFEIMGNHVDHNHGQCIAATCDLTIKGVLKKRDDLIVTVQSEGFTTIKVDLSDLKPSEKEKATSEGLIRGIAAYLKDKGYAYGGFDVYSTSTIFPGAGVSSSAAFELFIAQIFNVYFNEGKIEKMLLCKAGQYAENEYFGKKSGLLDQIGVGYGNVSFIDFEDITAPKVDDKQFPFDDLHWVIVNTGGSHAKLNDLYSSIPSDMHSAAHKSGHNFLREGSLKEIEAIKDQLTENEYLRALHFYSECDRVAVAKKAIIEKDEQLFLDQVNGSRESSTKYLKNMMVGNDYKGSPLEACDLAMSLMKNKGACKINGGGFAGSIICAVPEKYLSNFLLEMGLKYGTSNIKEVSILKTGPSVQKI